MSSWSLNTRYRDTININKNTINNAPNVAPKAPNVAPKAPNVAPKTPNVAPKIPNVATKITSNIFRIHNRNIRNQLPKNNPEIHILNNYNEYNEYKTKMDKITFVILRYSRTQLDFNIFKKSYYSIKTFYPSNKIVVIDDNSIYIDKLFDKDLDIIYSEFKGAGEILPYYYYYKHKWSKYMLFIQDSMMIYRHFKISEINSEIRYLWYFNSGDGYTDDIDNEIKDIISSLHKTIENRDNKWQGCFGSTSLISFDIVELIENKYKMFSTLVRKINKRIQREAIERVFSIVLYNENIIAESMFGYIFNYPFAFNSSINNHIDISKHNYDSAVCKLWLSR